MPDDPSCQAPQAPSGAVPRTCVPFAHVPAVPVMAVPYVPVPVPSGLPVLSVSGILPDRAGNVDVSQFLSSWAAEFAAAKADKASPAAAGNLASLDASGNLVDSGATPASIKAAAVAEVVANAPGTMDTLKEIADILGSVQQSGTVLKRILDLETGKADSSSLASVATSGSYDDLSDKPTIPAAVTVDATLAQRGAAADAEAVGDALRSGFMKWEFSGSGYDSTKTYSVLISPSSLDGNYDYDLKVDGVYAETVYGTSECPTSIDFTTSSITASRHLVTPTKTSQLENDGAPNGGGTPYATTVQVAAKQDALSSAQLANIADMPNKANAADLPYAMVTPGEWAFSGLPPGAPYAKLSYTGNGKWELDLYSTSDMSTVPAEVYYDVTGDENALEIVYDTGYEIITATRPSLPGHLLDRAGNRVVVSGDTTLTLPAAVPGYLRDFLVRLEISGSTVPTITFAAPTGETIVYETDGDEFPVPDEAGSWLYAFTETDDGIFDVSLKKVNTVAQGGAQ